MTDLVVFDTHVHFHACFDESAFLAAAVANAAEAARRTEPTAVPTAVLMLTESAGVCWYRTLRERAAPGNGGQINGGWRVETTAEAESLRLVRADGTTLYIVAGRQVVSAERLEVLWLGTAELPDDGAPLEEVIADARAAGAVPVLPWGFGKWMGRRGRRVGSLLASTQQPRDFHLGDNAARPVFWPRPSFFARAQALGQRVLPGSDPLPFATEVDRVARFGAIAEARLPPETPAAALKALIDDPAAVMRPYGRPETVYRFFRNQLAMQRHMRAHRGAGR